MEAPNPLSNYTFALVIFKSIRSETSVLIITNVQLLHQ